MTEYFLAIGIGFIVVVEVFIWVAVGVQLAEHPRSWITLAAATTLLGLLLMGHAIDIGNAALLCTGTTATIVSGVLAVLGGIRRSRRSETPNPGKH